MLLLIRMLIGNPFIRVHVTCFVSHSQLRFRAPRGNPVTGLVYCFETLDSWIVLSIWVLVSFGLAPTVSDHLTANLSQRWARYPRSGCLISNPVVCIAFLLCLFPFFCPVRIEYPMAAL